MKDKIKAYFKRPKRKIASDLFFWGLVVLLIIPSTRSVFLGVFAKLRTAVFSPAIKATEGGFLTEQDYQWRLSDLEGRQHSLGEFKGEVLFINFWATWCPPCRAEMPSIEKLSKVQGLGFRVLAVSSEEESVVKEFIADKGYTFPVYLARGQTPQLMQSRGIPATFIFNRAGQLVYQKTGAFDWNSKKVRKFLDELQSE